MGTIPEFNEAMQLMDVNREDIVALFGVLDSDHSGGVAYDQFVEQLHKIKSQDPQVMLAFVTSYIKDLRNKVTDIDSQLSTICADQKYFFSLHHADIAATAESYATIEGSTELLHSHSNRLQQLINEKLVNVTKDINDFLSRPVCQVAADMADKISGDPSNGVMTGI